MLINQICDPVINNCCEPEYTCDKQTRRCKKASCDFFVDKPMLEDIKKGKDPPNIDKAKLKIIREDLLKIDSKKFFNKFGMTEEEKRKEREFKLFGENNKIEADDQVRTSLGEASNEIIQRKKSRRHTMKNNPVNRKVNPDVEEDSSAAPDNGGPNFRFLSKFPSPTHHHSHKRKIRRFQSINP